MANWDSGGQWDTNYTNLNIIKRALKKLHVLPSGMDPTAAQAYDAMEALRGLVMEMVGMGTFGRLYDVIANADVTAMEWSRIRCDTPGIVITLPTTITASTAGSWPWNWYGAGPDYGWWYVDGWASYPRPPFNMAPIVYIDSDGNETTSIYNAFGGEWVQVNNMAQQDSFPFAAAWREGFAAMLAERLVDEYAATLGAQTAKQAAWCRYSLTNRFGDGNRRDSGSCASYF